MENLEKALELRKAKYLKRTGSPGNYKYVYRKKTERRKKGIEREIKKAYNWIFGDTKNKFEAMVILNARGEIVANRLGEKSSIDLTDILPSLKGNIFLHNHPNNASFSDSDIYCALTTGMKEIRAVGEKYEYVFRPAEYLLESKINRKKISAMKDFYALHGEVLVRGHKPRIEAGEMTADEANMEHWHELAKRFVTKFGGFYERRER